MGCNYMKKKSKRMICIKFVEICIAIMCIPNIYIFKYINNTKKVVAESSISDTFIVMSYNIRCWTFLDIEKKSWFYRASLVLDNIESIKPDIMGFQEVTSIQYKYLQNKLEGFDSIIEYRDNTLWSEGCPIFFNSNKYELIKSDTFWLSETPQRISKSWGAANYRICSYVILHDKQTNLQLAVFNTHLDHQSEEARIRGIEVIQDMINTLSDMPIILMGDFNATESTETYLYITEKFKDAKYFAYECSTESTFQNWGKETGGDPIDYIMICSNNFQVEKYYIENEVYNGVYPSDHFPVCVEIKWTYDLKEIRNYAKYKTYRCAQT